MSASVHITMYGNKSAGFGAWIARALVATEPRTERVGTGWPSPVNSSSEIARREIYFAPTPLSRWK